MSTIFDLFLSRDSKDRLIICAQEKALSITIEACPLYLKRLLDLLRIRVSYHCCVSI